MVVLLIAGIMAAIALPAFEAIASGSGVQTGTRNIGSLLSLGRSYAMAKRQLVAVILPGANSGVREADRYRSARLAYVTDSGTAYEFSSWVEDSAWLYLPPGASIMEADNEAGIHDGTGYARTPVENDATEVDKVDLTGPLAGEAEVDNVRAIIFSGSGKLKGQARYITVGQAIYIAGAWKIENEVTTATNESCANQLTIEINRYTGGIRYLTPEQY
jgi:hypothetical protein